MAKNQIKGTQVILLRSLDLILRAVGSQCPFFVLVRSSGFGMENGWDVHRDHGRYSGKR